MLSDQKIQLPRYLSILFYVVCIGVAVLCFYFSISQGLFYWFHADELNASRLYDNYGLLGCLKNYYFQTAINRVSAGFAVCAMAKTVTLFSTPYIGWVFARFVFYALIPISMAFLLKEMISIPWRYGIVIALLVSAVALFVISASTYYIFGLDLAIYATATFTFFALIALFSKSTENNLYFIFFCIIYVLNLNSHELFLVISGFFVPLFVWYRYINMAHGPFSLTLFIKNTLRDNKVWVLFVIYLTSVLITVLAPGVKMRQNIWPSSGTLYDGFVHMLLSIEEASYFIIKSSLLVFTIFILGILLRLSNTNMLLPKRRLLYVFLFSAPLAYLLLTGFLLGITPSLWCGSLRSNMFRIIEPFFNDSPLLKQGGFGIRQNIFFYESLFLNFFLAGFFITDKMTRINDNLNSKYSRLFKPILPALTLVLFLFHPEGVGSAKVLVELSKNEPYFKSETSQTSQPHTIVGFISPSLFHRLILSVSHVLFPTEQLLNHDSSLANLAANNYLKMNRGHPVAFNSLALVFDLMYSGYRVTSESPWIEQICDMYNVILSFPCVTFSNERKTGAACHQVFGEKAFVDHLVHDVAMPSIGINLKEAHGMEVKTNHGQCTQVTDLAASGEHFVSATGIQLSKGLNYFIFKSKPNIAQLYIYIIGEKTSILFPWLNVAVADGWSIFGNRDVLVPLFSQKETSLKSEKIRIVIYSAVDQSIQLRWQHGQNGRTDYKGNEEKITTNLCDAKFGVIKESINSV